MNLKSDSRGVTLVELIIAISLLVIVLSGAYHLLGFSTSSLKTMEAQFCAEQDARTTVLFLEEDIRNAQSVSFNGTYHKAVELADSGMGLHVYVDTDKDGDLEAVHYKLENHSLKRGITTLGNTPTDWKVIAIRVKNKLVAPNVSIFSIHNEVISIHLLLLDEKDRITDTPVVVQSKFTVRSKGAMGL